jgi:hypothetical protein
MIIPCFRIIHLIIISMMVQLILEFLTGIMVIIQLIMDISINIDIHKKIGSNMTKDAIIAIVVCKDS